MTEFIVIPCRYDFPSSTNMSSPRSRATRQLVFRESPYPCLSGNGSETWRELRKYTSAACNQASWRSGARSRQWRQQKRKKHEKQYYTFRGTEMHAFRTSRQFSRSSRWFLFLRFFLLEFFYLRQFASLTEVVLVAQCLFSPCTTRTYRIFICLSLFRNYGRLFTPSTTRPLNSRHFTRCKK